MSVADVFRDFAKAKAKEAEASLATDDDRRAYKIAKGSLKLLGVQINSLTRDYWISVLERYGVLPNYTLLDDSVTLDVGVTCIDPDTNEYMGEELSYEARRVGQERNEEEQQQVQPQEHIVDAAQRAGHPVVRDPDCADREETDPVGQIRRPLLGQAVQ